LSFKLSGVSVVTRWRFTKPGGSPTLFFPRIFWACSWFWIVFPYWNNQS
jgi:hypothetical protein